MSRLQQLVDRFTADLALELVEKQLDAAGITDPVERAQTRQLVVDYFATERAVTESSVATKH